MHRIGAVAHKSSTCLCTGSREQPSGRLTGSSGWARGAGTRLPGPARRVRGSETGWSIAALPGRDRRPPLPGSRHPQAETGCALVGTDMIKVSASRNHYPLPMAAEFYAIYRLLLAFLCRLAQNLDICTMRANSQS